MTETPLIPDQIVLRVLMDIVAVEIPFLESDIPDASDSFFSFQSIRELCDWLYDIDRFGDTKE